MKFKRSLVALFSLYSTVIFAHDTAAQVIEIHNPYVRAVPAGQPTSAAYMVLTNNSNTSHQLVAVTSAMVDHIQIHMTSNNNGVMQMREVGAVTIAPHQGRSFEPGRLHMMLLGLKQPLRPGATVPLTLVFEDKSTESVQATVKPIEVER